MPAGSTSVPATRTRIFEAQADGGRVSVYKINPTDGPVRVEITGMPGHVTCATDAGFVVPEGETEYFSLDQIAGGDSAGGIREVWVCSESGNITVNHGAVAARR